RRWSWQKRGPCPAVEKTLRGKVQQQTFPPSLEIPQKARDSHFPTAPTTADVLQRPCPKTQTRRKSHYPWTKNGGQVKFGPLPPGETIHPSLGFTIKMSAVVIASAYDSYKIEI